MPLLGFRSIDLLFALSSLSLDLSLLFMMLTTNSYILSTCKTLSLLLLVVFGVPLISRNYDDSLGLNKQSSIYHRRYDIHPVAKIEENPKNYRVQPLLFPNTTQQVARLTYSMFQMGFPYQPSQRNSDLDLAY